MINGPPQARGSGELVSLKLTTTTIRTTTTTAQSCSRSTREHRKLDVSQGQRKSYRSTKQKIKSLKPGGSGMSFVTCEGQR